jgi:hypothetical protein
MSGPTDPTNDRNDADHTGVYDSSVYVFPATGGFSMERGFETIKLAAVIEPTYVDVTDAVQVTMDVATFNGLLGDFSTVTDSFENNTITLDAETFSAGVTAPTQVISVGKYSTLYSDFQGYVAAYFGTNGFETLFTAASEFKIDEANVFDADAFIALLTNVPDTEETGASISTMTGAITIADVDKLLKYSVDANVFGNRDPTSGTDWGVSNGFQPGDLIWVPAGTTIVLNLAIDAESFLPLNNIGTANATGISSTQSTTFTQGENFSLETEASTTLITRTAKAPLLIKLVSV